MVMLGFVPHPNLHANIFYFDLLSANSGSLGAPASKFSVLALVMWQNSLALDFILVIRYFDNNWSF